MVGFGDRADDSRTVADDRSGLDLAGSSGLGLIELLRRIACGTLFGLKTRISGEAHTSSESVARVRLRSRVAGSFYSRENEVTKLALHSEGSEYQATLYREALNFGGVVCKRVPCAARINTCTLHTTLIFARRERRSPLCLCVCVCANRRL